MAARFPALFASIALACGALPACGAGHSLPEPGVLAGERLVSKRIVHGDVPVGTITSISDASATEGALMVVGTDGAATVGRDGALLSSVPFDRSGGDTFPMDIDGDGRPEFINCGGGWQPVSLIASDGKTRWSFRGTSFVSPADTMAVSDLDGDGKQEFLVGMNAFGGLAVLDDRGRIVRRIKAGNVFSVATVEAAAGAGPEIIHSDRGKIVVRSADGSLLRALPLPFSSFSVRNESASGSKATLVGVGSKEGKNTLYLFDLTSLSGRTYTLPDDGHFRATAVMVRRGGDELVAAGRTLKATGYRSALYVFTAAGELLYHEVFATSSIALYAPAARPGVLFVGVEQSVWLYELRPH